MSTENLPTQPSAVTGLRSAMAHCGTPAPGIVLGGAALLIVATVWLISMGEAHGGLIALVFLAATEALAVISVTAIGIALLPDVHPAYGHAEIIFHPILAIMAAGACLSMTASLWWCLQVWTEK
ncbi:hypothetical protein [Nocardia sp. NPDC020380]|uniref:hypothetical protein n=1 Tax=Nocardia sp. NPDC020380 TaxID=3364309 RepID=UPI003791D5C9